MHGADYSPEELRAGITAVARSASFARAYAEARDQALDALEYLRPFPYNRYRRALEEIALYIVDRDF
jgi:heptaprenyl diphosphate synthase